MSWHALYRQSDGSLVDQGSTLWSPIPPGHSVVTLGARDETKEWDPTTRLWKDKVVQPLRDLLQEFVDDPDVQQAMLTLLPAARQRVRDKIITFWGRHRFEAPNG